MDNLNVLVEAKKEYLGQMCLIMYPPMIEVFDEMYNEAMKNSKGKQVLIMFQKHLKEVPNWSNAMSKRHSDNITDRCSWFGDLLAAVFVACTKILSAVRLTAGNKKISLKLPTEPATTISRKTFTGTLTFSMMNRVSTFATRTSGCDLPYASKTQ